MNILKEIKNRTFSRKNLELRFEHYYELAKENIGLSKIYTPSSVRNKMLKYTRPGDKILILFNFEFCHDLYIKGFENVIFMSDDKMRNKIVETAYNYRTKLINPKYITKNIKDMKFDLIISNPPYNNSLDLKILKEIYEIGDRICFIHPSTWLYDNRLKCKLFIDARELVKDHFISYEKIESPNKVFGICIFNDILITYMDKNKKGIGDAIYDIDKYDKHPPI